MSVIISVGRIAYSVILQSMGRQYLSICISHLFVKRNPYAASVNIHMLDFFRLMFDLSENVVYDYIGGVEDIRNSKVGFTIRLSCVIEIN